MGSHWAHEDVHMRLVPFVTPRATFMTQKRRSLRKSVVRYAEGVVRYAKASFVTPRALFVTQKRRSLRRGRHSLRRGRRSLRKSVVHYAGGVVRYAAMYLIGDCFHVGRN